MELKLQVFRIEPVAETVLIVPFMELKLLSVGQR